MRSSFQNRCQAFARCGFALLLFQCSGCAAHLATVRTKPARLPAGLHQKESLEPATRYLSVAEHEQSFAALGHDLLATKISYGVLQRHPKNESGRSIYNFAVARVVQDVDRTNIEPWRHSISVSTEQGGYTLVSPTPVDAEHDPSRYDLFPTDALEIGGKFFKTYTTVNGIGAPIAVVGRTESPHFRQQYKFRRVYAPVTSIVRFSGRQARLEFIDPLKTERITLNKQVFPLAADFDAPTALSIARERPERLGLSRVINPAAYANTAMLCRLQQFDPAKTPVIFVHGLQETGANWAPMIDSLRDDPDIREHYQFWFFSYPSGYPYPYAAALFRQDLDGIKRAFLDHTRVVLIGHSMGGMICRLMITDAGDKIWRDFFATPPAKTPLAKDTRKLLEESLVFNHRSDVERVIFISTPHRGSKLASGWIGRVGIGITTWITEEPELIMFSYLGVIAEGVDHGGPARSCFLQAVNENHGRSRRIKLLQLTKHCCIGIGSRIDDTRERKPFGAFTSNQECRGRIKVGGKRKDLFVQSNSFGV